MALQQAAPELTQLLEPTLLDMRGVAVGSIALREAAAAAVCLEMAARLEAVVRLAPPGDLAAGKEIAAQVILTALTQVRVSREEAARVAHPLVSVLLAVSQVDVAAAEVVASLIVDRARLVVRVAQLRSALVAPAARAVVDRVMVAPAVMALRLSRIGLAQAVEAAVIATMAIPVARAGQARTAAAEEVVAIPAVAQLAQEAPVAMASDSSSRGDLKCPSPLSVSSLEFSRSTRLS